VDVFAPPAHIAKRIFPVFDTMESTGHSSGSECLYRQKGVNRVTLYDEDFDQSTRFGCADIVNSQSVGHGSPFSPSQKEGTTPTSPEEIVSVAE
jgi:hypothetical protein